eukprot:scaffold32124_cov77-Phaeocystis_antarctica.AAC.2
MVAPPRNCALSRMSGLLREGRGLCTPIGPAPATTTANMKFRCTWEGNYTGQKARAPNNRGPSSRHARPQRVTGRGIPEGVRGFAGGPRPSATVGALRHGGGSASTLPPEAGDGRAAASRSRASRAPSAAAARWRWLSGVDLCAGVAERRSAESESPPLAPDSRALEGGELDRGAHRRRLAPRRQRRVQQPARREYLLRRRLAETAHVDDHVCGRHQADAAHAHGVRVLLPSQLAIELLPAFPARERKGRRAPLPRADELAAALRRPRREHVGRRARRGPPAGRQIIVDWRRVRRGEDGHGGRGRARAARDAPVRERDGRLKSPAGHGRPRHLDRHARRLHCRAGGAWRHARPLAHVGGAVRGRLVLGAPQRLRVCKAPLVVHTDGLGLSAQRVPLGLGRERRGELRLELLHREREHRRWQPADRLLTRQRGEHLARRRLPLLVGALHGRGRLAGHRRLRLGDLEIVGRRGRLRPHLLQPLRCRLRRIAPPARRPVRRRRARHRLLPSRLRLLLHLSIRHLRRAARRRRLRQAHRLRHLLVSLRRLGLGHPRRLLGRLCSQGRLRHARRRRARRARINRHFGVHWRAVGGRGGGGLHGVGARADGHAGGAVWVAARAIDGSLVPLDHEHLQLAELVARAHHELREALLLLGGQVRLRQLRLERAYLLPVRDEAAVEAAPQLTHAQHLPPQQHLAQRRLQHARGAAQRAEPPTRQPAPDVPHEHHPCRLRALVASQPVNHLHRRTAPDRGLHLDRRHVVKIPPERLPRPRLLRLLPLCDHVPPVRLAPRALHEEQRAPPLLRGVAVLEALEVPLHR